MGNKAGHRSAPAGGVGPRVTVCVVFIFYSHAPMLDFSFDHSEERPLEAFEDIFSSYESKK